MNMQCIINVRIHKIELYFYGFSSCQINPISVQLVSMMPDERPGRELVRQHVVRCHHRSCCLLPVHGLLTTTHPPRTSPVLSGQAVGSYELLRPVRPLSLKKPLSLKYLWDRGLLRLRAHLKSLNVKKSLSHKYLRHRDHIQTAPISQKFER